MATTATPSLHPHHPPRATHYRPFSTLYTTQPSFIDFDHKPPRKLKRASSSGGLHSVYAMAVKDKLRSKSDHSNIPKVSDAPKQISAPLRLLPKSYASRPPSPHVSPPTIKKKRSMASLFSSAHDPLPAPHQPIHPIHHAHHPPGPSAPAHSRAPSTSAATPAPPPHRVTFAPDSKVLSYNPDVPHRFVPKTTWSTRHKSRLHPYGDQATYMQSYDRVLLDNERYSDLLLQRLSNGSPAFCDYGRKPPATALDLGCGAGHWIIHAANVWRNTQITGFDMVNVLDPAFETLENAHFEQGNFLQFKLPFPDKSFEYVRMANLVLCIPFNQWECVLSEAHRVLTVGGTLEVIDDQLFFPYAKPPHAPTPSTPNPRVPSRRFSNPFDDFDDDEDSETLREETSSSESTLHSEPCSFDDKHSRLVDSPTVRPPSSLPRSSARESRVETWNRQANAARDLENIFEAMLSKQHGIFPRPSEFIIGLLGRVFGKDNCGKKKSFHLKLAPSDSPIGVLMEDHEDELSPRGATFTHRGKKAWMSVDWDKKRRDKRDRKPTRDGVKVYDPSNSSDRSSFEDTSGAILSSPIPASVNAKAAERLGLTLPKPIRAPTTKSLPPLPRLATSTSPTSGPNSPSEFGVLHGTRSPFSASPVSDSPNSSPSPTEFSPSPPSAPTPQPHKTPMLSAKAAGRLGITYSELTSIAASTPNHPLLNFIPVQSPGLLVWPNTYIPMSPTELEMHACKHVHELIGCKAALMQFVSQFKDKAGNRYVEDAELEEAIWEYECFRRSRFNWPADVTDLYEDDPYRSPGLPQPGLMSPTTTMSGSSHGHGSITTGTTTTTASNGVAVSHSPSKEITSPVQPAPTNPHHYFPPLHHYHQSHHSQHETPRGVGPGRFDSSPDSESFNGQYRSEDLVHVRTVRVFQAFKSGDGSTSPTAALFGMTTPTKAW